MNKIFEHIVIGSSAGGAFLIALLTTWAGNRFVGQPQYWFNTLIAQTVAWIGFFGLSVLVLIYYKLPDRGD